MLDLVWQSLICQEEGLTHEDTRMCVWFLLELIWRTMVMQELINISL